MIAKHLDWPETVYRFALVNAALYNNHYKELQAIASKNKDQIEFWIDVRKHSYNFWRQKYNDTYHSRVRRMKVHKVIIFLLKSALESLK